MRTLISLILGLSLLAGAVYGGKRAWNSAVEWWQSPVGIYHLDRDATLNVKLAGVDQLVDGAARNGSRNDLELLFQRAAHQHIGNIMAVGIVESLNASWAMLDLESDGSFTFAEEFPLTGAAQLDGQWSWQPDRSDTLSLCHSGRELFGVQIVGSRLVLYLHERPDVVIMVLRKHNPITRAESWLKAKLRS